MNGQATHQGLRVGFVLFVALIILVAGLYVVAISPTVVGGTVNFTTHFTETGGLLPGAPVWIGGVEVGSVQDVGFTSNELVEKGRKEIEVALAVASRFADRVRQNSICRVKTRGLLGEKIVTIDIGSGESPPAPVDGALDSREGIDLEKALDVAGTQVDRTAAELVATLSELRKILQDVQQQRGILGKLIYSDEFYRDTIAQVKEVVAEVKKLLSDLNTTLREEIVTFRRDASGTLENLKTEMSLTGEEFRLASKHLRTELEELGRLVREVREGSGPTGKLINDAELAEALDRVVEHLEEGTRYFASVMAKLDRGEGTAGKLFNDPSAYTSMRDLFEGVQESWLLRGAVRDAEATGRELRLQRWGMTNEKASDEEATNGAKEK